MVGVDSSHAEHFLGHLNVEARYPGHRVTAICGADPARTGALASTFGVNDTTRTPASLVAVVDAVIVGDRDGRLHLDNALPALEAGLPVLIDKPLACSLADAEILLGTARRTGAKLLSASAVRWQPDVDRLRRRINRLGGAERLVVSGGFDVDSPYGGLWFYGVHTMELALELAGAGIEELAIDAANRLLTRVSCRVGSIEVQLLFTRLGPEESASFTAEAVGARGQAQQTIRLGRAYMAPVLDRFIAMLGGAPPPLSDADLLAPVRVLAALEAALTTSGPRRR